MKKSLFIVFVLSLFTAFIFADEHTLQNVPKEFTGTYVPVAFEQQLKEKMDYEKALNIIAPTNYDLLMLGDDICYTTLRFSDGYAVLAKDFEKWTFVNAKTEQYILDENGCSYRKISDDSSYNGYVLFAENALKIIFRDAIHSKNISIKNDKVTINGISYEIKLDPTYSSKDFICALDNGAYFLVKDGLGAKIVKGERSPDDRWVVDPTDKTVDEIPLFFWKDELYPAMNLPTWSMSKKDLRLLRNLFYAKHGYIFNSDDLQMIFQRFDWYKPNAKFSEDVFSNYEKAEIKSIRNREEN